MFVGRAVEQHRVMLASQIPCQRCVTLSFLNLPKVDLGYLQIRFGTDFLLS